MKNMMFAPPTLGTAISLTGLPGGSSKIQDRSSYGSIGTITGASWVKLPSGLWCLHFDGVDDHVEITHHSSLAIVDRITIKFWVRFACLDAVQALFDKDWTTAWDIHLWSTNRANARFQIGGALVECYAPAANFTAVTNTWYQWVVRYGGANLKIFINADEVDSDAGSGAIGTNNYNLRIGESRSGGSDLNGDIALIEIANRAWSAMEIQNSYDQEKHLFGVW
jgi:hypothetical protein